MVLSDSYFWLFYILVLILMWVCEDASHVCLYRHLDWAYSYLSGRDTGSLLLLLWGSPVVLLL